LYELPARRASAIRLLAIMSPGDLMTNTPLAFLIEDSDVALSMLYVLPGEPIPLDLPPHDVVFIAVSESDPTRALLDQLAAIVPSWNTPVINQPGRIAWTSRRRPTHCSKAPLASTCRRPHGPRARSFTGCRRERPIFATSFAMAFSL